MKRLLSLIAAVFLIFSLSVPAFAANETSGTTEVSYTVESGYTVKIPKSISLNQSEYINFQSENVFLDGLNKLYVKVDKNYHSNEFRLQNGDDYIPCTLEAGDASGSKSPLYETENVVAVFDSHSMLPVQYGRLYITPRGTAGFRAGTYTGTIHFEISVGPMP